MMTLAQQHSNLVLAVILSLASATPLRSQSFDVTGRADVTHRPDQASHSTSSSADVVVWLTPTQRPLSPQSPKNIQQYRLIQKNKSFTPHLLVVPTGSSIDFPNLDPFFHNVFSLFNGKRFDLGLYEAHTHRTVLFDREGVSYIFCNIHPEMGAVVITLSTPYYAISGTDGSFTIHNVSQGTYRMNVWAENAKNDALAILSRDIQVGPESNRIDTIRINANSDVQKGHKNKFGEDYPVTAHELY